MVRFLFKNEFYFWSVILLEQYMLKCICAAKKIGCNASLKTTNKPSSNKWSELFCYQEPHNMGHIALFMTEHSKINLYKTAIYHLQGRGTRLSHLVWIGRWSCLDRGCCSRHRGHKVACRGSQWRREGRCRRTHWGHLTPHTGPH